MEEDYDVVEWEEGRIDSIWHWTPVDHVKTLGMKGANNAGITLCQRRSRLKGSQLESRLYVCKALNGTRRQGMRSVKRELDMLRGCIHPHILSYEDFSYHGKSLDGMKARLYTEHCAHGDLDQFLTTGKKGHERLSFREGAQVFRQLVQALLYIHHGISIAEGTLPFAATGQAEPFGGSRAQDRDWHTILHRDIKPGNVFISERTQTYIQVKLGDFGLARLDSDESLTYVGTQNWLAPEQRHSNSNLHNERRTTLKSDIYSFGLTMAAVLPQMDSARRQPPAAALLDEDIRQTVRGCQLHQDSLRPSSIVMLERHTGLCRDTFKSHLQPSRFRLPPDFWTHETSCQLCRRMLKAGGVGYVDHFDRIRKAIKLAEPEAAKAELEKLQKELEEAVAKAAPVPDMLKAPIRFTDAVGRKFSYPWHRCKTWKGMESLIKEAFLNFDGIGADVQEGQYDLMGPEGEIILPQVWDTMIKPDWEVSMHMWRP